MKKLHILIVTLLFLTLFLSLTGCDEGTGTATPRANTGGADRVVLTQTPIPDPPYTGPRPNETRVPLKDILKRFE